MKTFYIEYKETSRHTISIEATTQEEALNKFYNGDNEGDFVDSDIEVIHIAS